MADESGHLGGAYRLESKDETRAFYADWAKTYDAEVRANGYASPARCAAALAEHAADRTAPVLDIGCGTGLSGEALRAAGFTTIDGTDFSDEMLAVAREKGIYRALKKGDVEEPLPAKPGEYANIAIVGVFSPGHAPASLIDEALALLPPGGLLVFTLNDHALEDPSYMARVMELVDGGAAELLVREHGPHLPKIGMESTVILLRKR